MSRPHSGHQPSFFHRGPFTLPCARCSSRVKGRSQRANRQFAVKFSHVGRCELAIIELNWSHLLSLCHATIASHEMGWDTMCSVSEMQTLLNGKLKTFSHRRSDRDIGRLCDAGVKPKFHRSSFLVASALHHCDILADTHDILGRMLRRCRACRMCRATFPFSLSRASLIGRPAVCCGVVLPVCPCVVSFSKFHEHDTHDLLRTSC